MAHMKRTDRLGGGRGAEARRAQAEAEDLVRRGPTSGPAGRRAAATGGTLFGNGREDPLRPLHGNLHHGGKFWELLTRTSALRTASSALDHALACPQVRELWNAHANTLDSPGSWKLSESFIARLKALPGRNEKEKAVMMYQEEPGIYVPINAALAQDHGVALEALFPIMWLINGYIQENFLMEDTVLTRSTRIPISAEYKQASDAQQASFFGSLRFLSMYLSMSESDKVVNAFDKRRSAPCYKLQVKVPAGFRFGARITTPSQHTEEREILLQAYTVVDVLEVTDDGRIVCEIPFFKFMHHAVQTPLESLESHSQLPSASPAAGSNFPHPFRSRIQGLFPQFLPDYVLGCVGSCMWDSNLFYEAMRDAMMVDARGAGQAGVEQGDHWSQLSVSKLRAVSSQFRAQSRQFLADQLRAYAHTINQDECCSRWAQLSAGLHELVAHNPVPHDQVVYVNSPRSRAAWAMFSIVRATKMMKPGAIVKNALLLSGTTDPSEAELCRARLKMDSESEHPWADNEMEHALAALDHIVAQYDMASALPTADKPSVEPETAHPAYSNSLAFIVSLMKNPTQQTVMQVSMMAAMAQGFLGGAGAAASTAAAEAPAGPLSLFTGGIGSFTPQVIQELLSPMADLEFQITVKRSPQQRPTVGMLYGAAGMQSSEVVILPNSIFVVEEMTHDPASRRMIVKLTTSLDPDAHSRFRTSEARRLVESRLTTTPG